MKLNKQNNTQVKNGFVFAVTSFAVSMIVGLVVVFMFNTVTLETTTASKTTAARVAFWKALSRVRMMEQLIKDYGFETVQEGELVGDVEFTDVDACHKRVVSEISIGDFTRLVEGLMENINCDYEGFPEYSMIFRVNDACHPGRGYGKGWRWGRTGRGSDWWAWTTGTGACLDIWGWKWGDNCSEDDDHGSDDDHDSDDHGGGGSGDDHDGDDDHGSDDDHDGGDSCTYGTFNILGESGRLDGEIYIGASTYLEYSGSTSTVSIGSYNTETKITVVDSATVTPSTPLTGNSYTWDTSVVLDLSDFDHFDYDSLLAIAAAITSTDADNGLFDGNVQEPYGGDFSDTELFYLQNYPNRTMYVKGNCKIKNCTILNTSGTASTPGIIVATGNIEIESITGGTVPDNIILVSASDVKIKYVNFGSDLGESSWPTVVNQIYAREKIELKGTSGSNHRALGRFYAFKNGKSFKSENMNTHGFLYAPNHNSHVDLDDSYWFKGALYVNRVKNDKFDNHYLNLHQSFPSNYFAGGIYGSGLNLGNELWVLMDGTLREI